MSQLTPSIYDYWSFYFSGKFHHTVRVIGDLSEFQRLPEEAKVGPVFAFVCRDFSALHAGLFAFGPLDLTAWQKDGRLVVQHVQGGVLGNISQLTIFAQTPELPTGKLLYQAGRQFAIEDQLVDLNGLSLSR